MRKGKTKKTNFTKLAKRTLASALSLSMVFGLNIPTMAGSGEASKTSPIVLGEAVDFSADGVVLSATGNAATVSGTTLTLGEAAATACGVEIVNPFVGNKELTNETLVDALNKTNIPLNAYVWKKGTADNYVYQVAEYATVKDAEKAASKGITIVTKYEDLVATTAALGAGSTMANMASLISGEAAEVSLPYPTWENGVTISTWVKASTDQTTPIFVFQDRDEKYLAKNNKYYGALTLYTDGQLIFGQDDMSSRTPENSNCMANNKAILKYDSTNSPAKNVGEWIYVTASIQNDNIDIYFNGVKADLKSKDVKKFFNSGFRYRGTGSAALTKDNSYINRLSPTWDSAKLVEEVEGSTISAATSFDYWLKNMDTHSDKVCEDIINYITKDTTKLFIGGDDGSGRVQSVNNSYGNLWGSPNICSGYNNAANGMQIKDLTFSATPTTAEEARDEYIDVSEFTVPESIDFSAENTVIASGNAATVSGNTITLGEASTTVSVSGVEIANPYANNTELASETVAQALENSGDKLNAYVYLDNSGKYKIAPYSTKASAEAITTVSVVTEVSALVTGDANKVINLASVTGSEDDEVSLPVPEWSKGINVSMWVKASSASPAVIFAFSDQESYGVGKENRTGGLVLYSDGTFAYSEFPQNSTKKKNSYVMQFTNEDTPTDNVGKWVYVTLNIKNDGAEVYYNGKAANVTPILKNNATDSQYFNYSYGFEDENRITDRITHWTSRLDKITTLDASVATSYDKWLAYKDSNGSNSGKNIMEYVTAEKTKLYLGGHNGVGYGMPDMPTVLKNDKIGYRDANVGMGISELKLGDTQITASDAVILYNLALDTKPDDDPEPVAPFEDIEMFDLSAGLKAGEGKYISSPFCDLPVNPGDSMVTSGTPITIKYNGETKVLTSAVKTNESTENPSPSNGAVPTAGACIKVTSVVDGTFTIVFRLQGGSGGKTFYLVDADGNIVNTETNTDNKWYCKSYPVQAGKTYYAYVSGSRITVAGLALAAGKATSELVSDGQPATTAPAATSAPAATTAPAATSAPAATTAPATTSAPANTTAPASTSAPAATTAPAATSAPAATTAPATTSAPAATTAPATTSAPAATTAPAEKTVAPIITKAPIASYDYSYNEDDDVINGVDKLLNDYNNATTSKDEFDNPIIKLGVVPDGEIGQGVRITNPFKNKTELHEDLVDALKATGVHFNGWTQKAAGTNLSGDEYNYVMDAASKTEAVELFKKNSGEKAIQFDRKRFVEFAASTIITGGGIEATGDGVTVSVTAVETGKDSTLLKIIQENSKVYYQCTDKPKDCIGYGGVNYGSNGNGQVNLGTGEAKFGQYIGTLKVYPTDEELFKWANNYVTSFNDDRLPEKADGKTLDEFVGATSPETSTTDPYTFPYPTWTKGVTVSTWVKVPAKVTDSAIEATGDAVTEEAVANPTIFEFSDNTASLYLKSDGTLKFMASSDASSNAGKNMFMATFDGNTPEKNAGEWVYVTLTIANDNIEVYYNGEKATMKSKFAQGSTQTKYFNYGTGFGTDNIEDRIADCVRGNNYRDLLQNYGMSTTYDDFSKYSFNTTDNYLQMVNFLTQDTTNLFLGGNNVVTECSYSDDNAGMEFGAINFYDYVVADSVVADQYAVAKELREKTPATPTPGDVTPTPTPGDATPTPTPGDATPTPTPGDVTPTPTPGDVTPTPTPGDVTPTPTPGDVTPTPTPAENTLLGDADLSGKIDLNDAVIVLKTALNITQLEGQASVNADADESGKIDLNDAVLVLKAALNIVTLTPSK